MVSSEFRLSCRFFRSNSGAEPVRQWLLDMNKDLRKVIGAEIAKVQRLWPISRPLVGAMKGGLFEVRIGHRRNEYRVFFGVCDNTMVLLHGFQKKTQQTPKADLELARKRLKEVLDEAS